MNQPNIVILCLDTVRKDYYDKYASRLRSMSSIQFEEMRALSSWSVPSHGGMLTGQVPSQTGVHAHQRQFESIDPAETLPGALTQDGYKSLCVSANVYASPAFGFDRFFDQTIPISPSSRFPEGMDVQQFIQNRTEEGIGSYWEFLHEALAHDHPLKTLMNGILLKLEDASAHLPFPNPFDYGARSIMRVLQEEIGSADQPVFAFTNIMDVHGPHAPFRGLDHDLHNAPPTYHSGEFKDWDVSAADRLGDYKEQVQTVRDLYAAEVDYVDRVISEAIHNIRKQTERDTIFIITADHGENLGYESEDYLMNHVSSLSEALLHVPFDVVGPQQTETVSGLTSHADLESIVRALTNEEKLSSFSRETAIAEIVGSGSGFPSNGDQDYWDRSQRVVYKDSRKYYCDELGNEAVYDISGEPSKQRLLADTDVPDGLFEAHFGPWVDKDAVTDFQSDIDDATQSRLEDLGYV